MVQAELLALKSIYSAPGEFQIKMEGSLLESETSIESLGPSFDGLEVRSCVFPTSTLQAQIVFTLPKSYPQTAPRVQMTCKDMPSELVTKVVEDTKEFMESRIPECCLFDTIEFCKSLLDKLNTLTRTPEQKPHASTCDSNPSDQWFGTLIVIDHMRSQATYLKLLRTWAEKLHVGLTVVNCGPGNIFAQLLAKDERDLDVFVKRWRTLCIDVDSHGRSCKEHQLTIVSHAINIASLEPRHRQQTWCVCGLSTT